MDLSIHIQAKTLAFFEFIIGNVVHHPKLGEIVHILEAAGRD